MNTQIQTPEDGQFIAVAEFIDGEVQIIPRLYKDVDMWVADLTAEYKEIALEYEREGGDMADFGEIYRGWIAELNQSYFDFVESDELEDSAVFMVGESTFYLQLTNVK